MLAICSCGQECATLSLEYEPEGLLTRSGYTAMGIDRVGRVKDIDLTALRAFSQTLVTTRVPKAVLLIGIGRTISRPDHPFVLIANEDGRHAIVEQLSQCFRITDEVRLAEDGELEEAFEFHTDQALHAIQAGRISELRSVLDALRE